MALALRDKVHETDSLERIMKQIAYILANLPLPVRNGKGATAVDFSIAAASVSILVIFILTHFAGVSLAG